MNEKNEAAFTCPKCHGTKSREVGFLIYLCEDCGTFFTAAKAKSNFEEITDSPEALAEFIKRLVKSCAWCLDGGNPPYCPVKGDECIFNDGVFEEWLKQLH